MEWNEEWYTQGYPSWNAWNVSLWVNNDEWLYREAFELVQKYGRGRAANILTKRYAGEKTPDGAKYNRRSFYLALEDM